jgi:hypothetical protein
MEPSTNRSPEAIPSLTFRQYLIGQAIAGTAVPGASLPTHCDLIAHVAVVIADAVIKEIEDCA